MSQHRQPHEYDRRILLCVSGMTPQIITETLYALAVQEQPAFVPTEIHVITTTVGENKIQQNLVNGPIDHLQNLSSDYQIQVPEKIHIRVITDSQDNQLNDVVTWKDNEAASDTVVNLVRELTQDDNCAIHASLAGGRKTMTFNLGYAMSLFGRPQDKLSHVLVTPEFEGCENFFFPPSNPSDFKNKKGQIFNSKDVEISLGQVAFLRLRDDIPAILLNGQRSFVETVRLAQMALEPPRLEIDLKRCRARCSGILVELTVATCALLAWFVYRVLENKPPITTNEWQDQEIKELLKITRDITGDEASDPCQKIEDIYYEEETKKRAKNFASRRNDLKEKIESYLGPELAKKYMPGSGSKRSTYYELSLEPHQIEFKDIPDEEINQ